MGQVTRCLKNTTANAPASRFALKAGLGLGLAGLGGLGYALFWPRSQWFGPVRHRGPASADPPRVALTFDDGPHPYATPAVLDILGKHHVPGAFFVIGENARAYPRIMRRIDHEGHLLANHSFSHDWAGLFHHRRYWQQQLRQTNAVIEQIVGRRPRLFRPPMGFKHYPLCREVRAGGYEMVTWTRRARDGWPTDAQPILERLANCGKSGDILTLHDGQDRHVNRDFRTTLNALSPLIEHLHERGFQFTRLDDLLNLPGYR